MNIHVILKNEDGSSQNPDAPLRKSWNDFHLWFVTDYLLQGLWNSNFLSKGILNFLDSDENY